MRSRGVTSVICSHALNAFEARVDRIAIIKQGNLVACGSLAELSERTALPVKIRVAVTPGQVTQLAERLGGDSGISQLNGQSVDIECLSSEKMAMIRRITELGDVIRDVDVTPPRLDEIYNYYMQEGSEAGS